MADDIIARIVREEVEEHFTQQRRRLERLIQLEEECNALRQRLLDLQERHDAWAR